MTAGDPLNPGIIFGGMGTRWNLETNTAVHGTTTPQSTEGARNDWTQPLVFSRADPHALYYANQFLFKTMDGARPGRARAATSPGRTRAFLRISTRRPRRRSTATASAVSSTPSRHRRCARHCSGLAPMTA
jgi:hypothetical protein